MLRKALLLVALAVIALALGACGGDGGESTTGAGLPAGCEQVAKPPPKHRELKRPPQTVQRGERLTATHAGLPPNYAILGKVSSGLDVVKRIGELGDPASGDKGTPMATVVIRRITVHGTS